MMRFYVLVIGTMSFERIIMLTIFISMTSLYDVIHADELNGHQVAALLQSLANNGLGVSEMQVTIFKTISAYSP